MVTLSKTTCHMTLAGSLFLWSSAFGIAVAEAAPDQISVYTSNLGVNSHINILWSTDYPYDLDPATKRPVLSQIRLRKYEAAVRYLGVSTVRDHDGLDASIRYAALAPDGHTRITIFQKINQDTGVRFVLPISGMPQSIEDTIRQAGIEKFIEGPNEGDNPGWLSYGDLTGMPAVKAAQTAIYTTMKANPATANIPVIQFSLGRLSSFPIMGPVMGPYAQYGNAHVYWGTGNPPGGGNATFIPDQARIVTPGKDVVVTETGYPTMQGDLQQSVSLAVQAKYTLSLLLDLWKQRLRHVYLYTLSDLQPDAGNTDRELHFGLFNTDWSPKPAAVAVHNLTTILRDRTTAPTTMPTTPEWQVVSAVPTVQSTAFLKRDGTLIVAVWNDARLSSSTRQVDVSVSPTPVRVVLNRVAAGLQVYDPLVGTGPIQTGGAFSDITLMIPDHPVLLFIPPT